MQASIFLARLIGPILVVAAAGVLLNRRMFAAMAQEILRSHVLIYLFGLLDLTAGLAIVLTHNIWTADWRVLITLIGWLSIVRGAVRILLPEQVMTFGAKMLKHEGAITASLAVALILGLILMYFGYAA